MAKDKHDQKTGNLLQTPNARRQATFKEKMRAEGKVQKTVWVDSDSFDAGFSAGLRAWASGESAQDLLPKIHEDQHYDVVGWLLGFEKGLEKGKTDAATD